MPNFEKGVLEENNRHQYHKKQASSKGENNLARSVSQSILVKNPCMISINLKRNVNGKPREISRSCSPSDEPPTANTFRSPTVS